MCDFATRITKLCQIAAQVEYEMITELAESVYWLNEHGSIESQKLRKARRQIVLRGDSWALTAFDRAVVLLKDNPTLCEQIVKGKRPAKQREESIREYLDMPRLPQELVCDEISDLVRTLEGL